MAVGHARHATRSRPIAFRFASPLSPRGRSRYGDFMPEIRGGLEMLHAGVRLAVTAASRIEEAIYTAGRGIPSIRWMKYAALRLGAFIMSYFSIVAAMAVVLALAGVAIGVGLVLALVPVAVFIAIRISGALTENRYPER